MNITNKSGKIVNIGQRAIMPGDSTPIDDSFATNDVITMLVAQGVIAITKKPTASKLADDAKATEEAAKKAAAEAAAKKAAADEEARKAAEEAVKKKAAESK